MYPMPVQRWRPLPRLLYRLSLPVALALALALWLVPLLAVLVTSVRSSDELLTGDYWGWPKHFALLENYGTALTQTPMLHYFWNSCLITLPAVAIAIFLASMAGHALANYRFRGNAALLGLFVAGNFVPIQILMIPVRELMAGLNLYNTVWALIIFHAAFQTGFCALFLRNRTTRRPNRRIRFRRLASRRCRARRAALRSFTIET